jgi:L-fuculose-phosphate aldolase
LELPEFQAAGRKLSDNGLVTGSSGNLSMRAGDDLFVTSHGSTLSNLSLSDIIKTPVGGGACPSASWELPVHRAIYAETRALAVAHAHPPCAVALSLQKSGKHWQGITAVLDAGEGIVPGAMAEEIAKELKKHPIVMVRGHGSFAVSKTLDEACRTTLAYEAECGRICRLKHITPAAAGE